MRFLSHSCCNRIARPQAYQHVIRGTAKLDDANEHAPVHSVDERILKEDSESRARDFALLHALQLLPKAYYLEGQDARDGCWIGRSCLVNRRIGWTAERIELGLTLPLPWIFGMNWVTL